MTIGTVVTLGAWDIVFSVISLVEFPTSLHRRWFRKGARDVIGVVIEEQYLLSWFKCMVKQARCQDGESCCSGFLKRVEDVGRCSFRCVRYVRYVGYV